MANPILAILGGEVEETSTADDKNAKKKTRAAEDLIDAVESKDAQGVVDAVTALYRLCELEG